MLCNYWQKRRARLVVCLYCCRDSDLPCIKEVSELIRSHVITHLAERCARTAKKGREFTLECKQLRSDHTTRYSTMVARMYEN